MTSIGAAGQLYREALVQALDNASCINEVTNDALLRRLNPLDDSKQETVNEILEGDEPNQDIEIIIAGLGVDIGLERLSNYLLEGFGDPFVLLLLML